MTRNPKTTLASAPLAASGRRRRLLDGPFAETKELLLGDWPSSAGRYVSVNGLRMYCEVHGRGRPLVLLHAALATIDITFSRVLGWTRSPGWPSTVARSSAWRRRTNGGTRR